jgi:hypothetical protein
MEAAFCVETLEDALARHGKPGIFNTDQGSQRRFKWSSQRFMRSYDDQMEAAIGSFW